MERFQNSEVHRRFITVCATRAHKKKFEIPRGVTKVKAFQEGEAFVIERGNLVIHEREEATMVSKLKNHVRENDSVNEFQEMVVSFARKRS